MDDGYGSENDSEVCDHAPVDGALEDAALKGSLVLTRQEVLHRRSRRVRQLIRIYRAHYWSFLEELRFKYRAFYLKTGKSGWKEEPSPPLSLPPPPPLDSTAAAVTDANANGNGNGYGLGCAGDDPLKNPIDCGGGGDGNCKQGGKDGDEGANSIESSSKCGTQGCKLKPLALSKFCFTHILSDPRQKLYKACTFLLKSGQNGVVSCGKPVLSAATPLVCNAHRQQTQKTSRTVKKAGLGVAHSQKPALKLHLIIAEYVRLIQTRRRSGQDSALILNESNFNKEMGNNTSLVSHQEPPTMVHT